MVAKSLMIQGTTSDAGKSTVALGICRLLKRAGKSVAPFKPQNMALNSAVTDDGGEIGRAQALQAIACGVRPHSDMNPVLLKPGTDCKAQVIVQGKVWKNLNAREYHANKRLVMPAVLESFHRLAEKHDCIVVEGAGSPAEINLREDDVANMGFATAANLPVLLVADIDRGGVFAHLYGTHQLLDSQERKRIVGFIINKFRGDPELLHSGIRWLENETGVPVLGITPYLQDLTLDAEDSLARRQHTNLSNDNSTFRVVIPDLPRMSNHTDFEPLHGQTEIDLVYAGAASKAPFCDLLILPGSKSVIADLKWLQQNGWVDYIKRHLRYGGRLLGICGGFQMLGDIIFDPQHVESEVSESSALGLLSMSTELAGEKTLRNVKGELVALNGARVEGYEIHMGVSSGPALQRPFARLDGRTDGAVSDDGQIAGTYLHGLFDKAESRQAVLEWCNMKFAQHVDFLTQRELSIDRVADALEAHTDWQKIAAIFEG